MNKPIRCAVIGQNPMRFPWGFDEEDKFCSKMKTELAQQIMVLRQRGVSQFLTACDCGVGLYAGEIINGLRTTDRDLMLICYIPHEEQATKRAPTCGNATLDILGFQHIAGQVMVNDFIHLDIAGSVDRRLVGLISGEVIAAFPGNELFSVYWVSSVS